MQDSTVIYQNRVVPRDGFRVFIYDGRGNQKLVNSYEEYMNCLESELWFSDNVSRETLYTVRLDNMFDSNTDNVSRETLNRRGRPKKEG